MQGAQMLKVLFLLKRHNRPYTICCKSGLWNSANLVKRFLDRTKLFETKLEVCIDGNSIDRELHLFKPDICILEAVWVTPEKLRELVNLHPKVVFIIRVHSEVPFLANEGIAIGWIREYALIKNVMIAFNSKVAYRAFRPFLKNATMYLPNVYDRTRPPCLFSLLLDQIQYFLQRIFCRELQLCKSAIHVGCLGAIRPMKNQLLQAMAAIRFADIHGKTLYFHINSSRTEQGGENILKNIRSLFVNSKHVLSEHPWLSRKEFINLVSSMDIGLQVSFTESFNIVAADFVKQNVPIVVSKAIRWMPRETQVDNIDEWDIVSKMEECLTYRKHYTIKALLHLCRYNRKAKWHWLSLRRFKKTCA